MKILAICLMLISILVGDVKAQRVKSMSGTVIKTVVGGRWTGIVIRVGNKTFGVQTSYEPSAGDETRGEKSWEIKSVGSFDQGRSVQVFYTKIDCTFAYEDGVPCWLKATRIVEMKRSNDSKKR